MQHHNRAFLNPSRVVVPADAPSPSLQNEVLNLLRFVRRRFRVLLLSALFGGILLGTYALLSNPIFRATSVIALDPNALQVLDTAEERAHKQDTAMQDSARVDSLVQVLQSDATLLRVIRKLDLQDDPEFNGSQPSVIRAAIAWIAAQVGFASPPLSESDRTKIATDTLALDQVVERAAGTYLVNVSILSKDPVKAATIANAFADDYLDDQRTSDIDTTRAAAAWMKTRLAVLSEDMIKTQGAVADFKSANNIATADGKSIADLMLSDVSTKLSDAIGQTAQAEAKLDRIVHVNEQTSLDLSVADALSDDVITDLRKKVLDLQGRASNIAAQYGDNHIAVQKLRAEADVAMGSIRNELKRLEESSRSDYAIALSNESAIRASLQDQFRKTSDVGRAQVKLQELDSAATTAQLAYEEALKRYTETVQKESFPMVQARIIARAVPPDQKFKPKTMILVAAGIAGGLFLSLGYALVSELFDRRIYSRRQAERLVGSECLGIVPLSKTHFLRRAASLGATRRPGWRKKLRGDRAVQQQQFVGAEAMLSIKIAFDQTHYGQGERVIGITSSLPGEGKTTVALNLAHLLVESGARVLLLDANLRRPALSERLHPTARMGLPDVLLGQPLGSVVVSDPARLIDFLPANTDQRVAHTGQLLASAAMKDLLQSASATYDYVVIDLPPLLPVVDVRIVAPLIDAFVVVLNWGRTDEDAVTAALDASPVVREKLLGVLLNKVRLNQLARHGESAPAYYSAAYHTS